LGAGAAALKRAAAGWGVLAGALIASVAHVGYWYLPRERGGEPMADETRRLLSDPKFDAAVWIPFPHQNLAVLQQRVGDFRAWARLLAGGDGARGDRLPSFGPVVVPPAYEMAVAWRRDGRNAAAIRVFPLVGALARVAGRLAGNPWLAGGEVPLERGRRGHVSWHQGVWRLDLTGDSDPGPAPRPAAAEPAPLALLRLGAAVGPLPAGSYRLIRSGEEVELRLGTFSRELPVPPLAGSDPPAAWRLEVQGEQQLSATLLWEREGPVPPFPAAAALRVGEVSMPHLPGEELLRLAGRKPLNASEGACEIRALDRGELDLARQAAPELLGAAAGNRRLRTWIGVDPEGLAAAARRVAARFKGLPLGALLGVDPAQLADRLTPLEGCGASSLAVEGDPPAVLWRLCPERPESAASR